MIQEAILFTKQNAEMIVEHLSDGTTVEDLLQDYGYLFETSETLVLGMDVLYDGFSCVSYVVHPSYYEANNDAELNDKTFTKVNEF